MNGHFIGAPKRYSCSTPRHRRVTEQLSLRRLVGVPNVVSEQLHSLPVSQMGNYQEYLKRMPTPLREIESTPVRQHMFGNPFKIEKVSHTVSLQSCAQPLPGTCHAFVRSGMSSRDLYSSSQVICRPIRGTRMSVSSYASQHS